MASTSTRLKTVGLVTAVMGGVVLPAPIAAAWRVLVEPLRSSVGQAPTARLQIVEHAWSAWLASHGYLPWVAWPVVFSQRDLQLTWLVGTAIVMGWLSAQVFRGQRAGGSGFGGPPVAGKGEHGTARWRTAAEVALTFRLWRGIDLATQRPAGVLIGQGPQPGTAYVHDGEEHVLLIGATGSGKSRRIILPTIGVIGSAAKSSMVITDPKGELYAHTAAWLRSQGYEIVRFDLREPSRSNRWNPVLAVTEALDAGRRDEASTLAWDAAHLLAGSLESTSGAGDPYWALSSEALIAALILAVAQGDPQSGIELDGERWTWPTLEQRHMASVYGTLLSGGAGGGRLDDLMAQFPVDHPAAKAYGPVQLSVEKTRSSILATAASALRLFGDDETAYLTGGQDHDLGAVGQRLTAVYLVIPDERSTRYPLATLYISQTLQQLASIADANGGKLPVPVNFLLDEFGNLPRIRDFEKTVSVARSRGIRLLLAVQDLAQIQRHYDQAAHTIQGNLRLWIYLSTSDSNTAKEIETKLGQYTVAGENLSVPRVTWWTTTATVGAASTTQSLMGRSLLSAEEVMRWPVGQSLVLQTGQLPARLPLPDLSAWAKVWPEIQTRVTEPEVQPVKAPPTWRPPTQEQAQAAANETGGREQQSIVDAPIIAGDAEVVDQPRKRQDQPDQSQANAW